MPVKGHSCSPRAREVAVLHTAAKRIDHLEAKAKMEDYLRATQTHTHTHSLQKFGINAALDIHAGLCLRTSVVWR